MYSIIIYSVLVLPNVIKRYWYNSEITKSTKLLNILIPLFFFTFYFEELRTRIWDIYENGLKSYIETNQVDFIPKEIGIATTLIYIVICLYASGLFLNIASRIKGRKFLFKSIPFLWLFTAISFLKFYIKTYGNEDIVLWGVFLTGSVITALPFVVLLLIYSRKSFKKLFSVD